MNKIFINRALLFALGFFATLGSGMTISINVDISKVYPVVCVLVIIVAFLNRRLGKGGYSKPMWIFLGFITLHTCIVYGLIHPEEFGFGYTGYVEIQNGIVRFSESLGIRVARLFLFGFTGWAVSRLVQNKKEIECLAFGYFAGLLYSVYMGGYQSELAYEGINEIRIAAGFLNPNAFGLVALTCFFLFLTVLPTLQGHKAIILYYLGIIFSGACIIMSGSRGALLATTIGIVIFYSKDRNKLFRVVTGIAVLYLSYVLVNYYNPDVAISSLSRSSLERINIDQGAGRLLIWHDYLARITDYLFLGVGYKRSMEALSQVNYYKMAVTHNVYLGFLVEFGLAGFVLFLIMLISSYRKCRNAPAPLNNGLMALLAAWATQSFFLDSMDMRDTWLIFGLCSSTFCVRPSAVRLKSEL